MAEGRNRYKDKIFENENKQAKCMYLSGWWEAVKPKPHISDQQAFLVCF